ncbi:MAG: SDR family oxidoreductase [Pseudomonadota bacterium]
MAKTILITGSNSGFGLLAVQSLLDDCHTVIGSMRDIDGRNHSSAESLRALGGHVVEIDVTSNDSVEQGCQEALEINGGIDVLVNNAGVGVHGIQEMFTPEDMQHIFDINVFGVQRMTRAMLPHFHQRGDGLIVMISSLLGRVTMPFYGPYNASKWALEALSENYRTELSQFGIDVSIVEPGGFPTNFMERLVHPGDQSRRDAYGAFADQPEASFKGFQELLANTPEQNPQLVADAIVNVINGEAGKRPFRTPVDRIGMGDAVAGYNDHLHQVTAGIYGSMGIEGLLQLSRG